MIRCFLLLLTVLAATAEDTAWTWQQWRITAHDGLSVVSGATTICGLGINDLKVATREAIPNGVRQHGTVGDRSVLSETTFQDGVARCTWHFTKGDQPASSEVLIGFASGDLAGSSVLMDGTAVAIPKQFVSHEFQHATTFRFHEAEPGKRLQVTLDRGGFANLRDFRNVSGRSDLQIFALPDAHGDLALSFDLTRSADESRNEHFAGERYAWLDDLHLQAPSGVNSLANPSFEGGLDQWGWGVTDWRDPPGEPVWSVDETSAHTGRRSARYTVHAGWHPRMLCSAPQVLQTGTVYTISFWAKADKPDAAIDVFAHFSEWGKFPLIQRERIGATWERHVLQVTAATPFMQLCFGDLWWREAAAQVDGAHIWLDDIQIEAGNAPSAFAMPAVHCASSTGTRDQVVFGDALAATPLLVTLTNAADHPATITVDLEIQDFSRSTLLRQQLSAALPAWSAQTVPVTLSGLDRRGLLRVVMITAANGGLKTTFYGRVAVLERIADPGRVRYAQHIEQPTLDEARWQQQLGVSGSLGFALPEQPGLVPKLSAGDWTHIISPNGGKDCPVDIFHKRPDEAGWTAYDAWLATNVRAHPGTTWWKTYNEPNCGGYTWTIADYVRGVELMRHHIKAQDPQAKVLTPDCYNASRNGQAWLDDFLTAGGAKLVDALAIHSYRARPEEPDLDRDIQELVKLKAKHGLSAAPILFTEGEGYPPHTLAEIGMTPFGFYEWRLGLMGRDVGRSELTAAALMVRTWLTCLKNADQVTFYLSWMTDAIDGQPRATLAAMNHVLSRLRHAAFERELVLGDEVRCYLFSESGHDATAVVWSYDLARDRGERPALDLTIPLPAGAAVVDLMGNPLHPPSDATGSHLAVSGWPLFISVPAARGAELIAACERATSDGAAVNPLLFTSRLAADGKVAVTATERLGRPVMGALALGCGDRKCHAMVGLAAKGSKTISIALPEEQPGRIMETVINEHFDAPDAHIDANRRETLRWLAIHHLPAAVTIDGDAADWAGIAPLTLGQDALMTWGDNSAWKDQADLSAQVRLGWRDDGLYGCVTVSDDVPVTDQPIASAWQQDSLQLYLDLNADGRDKPGIGYGNDDESLYIAHCAGVDQLWRDYTPEWQIAFVKAGLISDGAVAIRRSGNLTTYEFRLPPAQVFPLALRAGTTCGLGLLINDADGPGRPRKALTLTPPGTEPHGHPELWPAAILVE